jgi:SNF2 family DNA or RNA helicase
MTPIHHTLLQILDESHAIKNKRAGTSKAVFALTAERRWCLSGTPLQNRVSELFSMIRFLRIKPFANYYCKNCPCDSLDYRFGQDGRACEVCGHSPMRHYQWLNKYVMNPIRAFGYVGPGLQGMKTLRHTVLDDLVLRRTKAGRAADLALPHRTIILRNDLELDQYESDFYQALYTQSKARFGAYVQQGTLLQNYAHLFDLLTRLRQAVDHPFLILYGANATASGQGIGDTGAGSGAGGGGGLQDVCGVCREAAEDPVLTGCRHVFCRMCMKGYLESLGGNAALGLLKDRTLDDEAWIGDLPSDGEEDASDQEGAGAGAGKGGKGSKKKAGGGKKKGPKSSAEGSGAGGSLADSPQPTCPTCYASLTVDLQAAPIDTSAGAAAGGVSLARRGILSRIPRERVGGGFKSSTKIEALLCDLWRVQEQEPGAKALVFSQFVNMLDLIQHRLTHAGVRCVKLDGWMTVAARER